MASTYDLKYVPPKKGDEWKPETLVGALQQRQKLENLNPQSKKDLETIANTYTGAEVLNKATEKDVGEYVDAYKAGFDTRTAEYVLGNLKSAIKDTDQQRLIPLAMQLPVKKRKAGEGTELSEDDKKYNAVVEAVLNLREIDEARQNEEGLEAEVKKELEGINDDSKKFWSRHLGSEKIYNHRRGKAVNKAVGQIGAYGLAPYFSEAIKLSDVAEAEFAEKAKSLEETMKKEIESLAASTGVSPTPQQIGEVKDKYAPETEKLQEEYVPLIRVGKMNVKQFILNGQGKEIPGLNSLIANKYLTLKAEEEAKEAAKKKAEEEEAAKKK
ncbi:hypothetical protein KA107_03000 [Candidatus Pacearchaeota archaeon]|nr:hypothetical protein [Candidatus Pacearchaeota archaeon]